MQTRPEPLAYPFEPGTGLELNPLYAELRERPLARVRMSYGDDAWLATRYADVKTVLSDARFSLAEAVGQNQPRTQATAWDQVGLTSLEPPEHTRLRGLLAKEFSARRVERLRVHAHEVADELLDRVVESGPSADLVEQFAIPLPTTLNCELLGVPREHSRIWAWVEANLFGAEPDQSGEGAAEFYSHMAELVELRRRKPGEDLLSSLLRACDRDGLITEDELLALVGDLLVAGFVTVAGQIATSVYHLLTRPEEVSRLRERPELIPRAAEELLRYVQLIDFTAPRYATEDVELGGVLVRAGEPVLAALAAANRDPAVFADADDLVLDRSGAAHLGFGHGAHFCVGAQLARLELQVALETVLRRLPGLRLAVPEDGPRWKTGGIVNGLHGLPVTFDTASGAQPQTTPAALARLSVQRTQTRHTHEA
ncbi:cytochrome P450 [Streptomyces tsukubensis]|uniref:Cytochrome n=1 Tax=Streptomyces tsukubensis TaxID=83656 RepID=A0A1V4ADW3_9ACTN|nr:cytochrome P450 [Streptomyces tsukubensis]OON81673.1 cytochrome [Streptomyces tsukubensis]QFR96450.1 cytochrome P450 [Streptomyces tsukubensis]